MDGTIAGGNVTFELTLPMLDYVDVDGNAENNSEHGGDAFRISTTASVTLIDEQGQSVFRGFSPSGGVDVGDVFRINNPDVDRDGNSDFSRRVLLENLIEYGRGELRELFASSGLETAFDTADRIIGSVVPLNQIINFGEMLTTLSADLLDNIDVPTDPLPAIGAFSSFAMASASPEGESISPGLRGKLQLNELFDFGDVGRWLQAGLPSDLNPDEIAQLQLNDFAGVANPVELNLSDYLPQSMRDAGWTITAELLQPSIEGNLKFGIDTSSSPFYLSTGTRTEEDVEISDSELHAGLTILVSIANPTLFPGRLTLEEASGAIRPTASIDFAGTGGDNDRLRLSEWINDQIHVVITSSEAWLNTV
ncbi:MAG: hypothetical protein R3C05_08665 [Pirellulaceae bacterium]